MCVCVCVCVLFKRYQSERVARRQPVQSHQFRQSHQSYYSVAAVLEALSIAQRGASVMILTRRRRYELKRHFEFRFLNVFCAPERKSRTSECSVDPDASVVRSWSRRLFAPSYPIPLDGISPFRGRTGGREEKDREKKKKKKKKKKSWILHSKRWRKSKPKMVQVCTRVNSNPTFLPFIKFTEWKLTTNPLST